MKKVLFFIVLFTYTSSFAQTIDTITSFDYDTSTHTFLSNTQQVFTYNGSCILTRYQINFWDNNTTNFVKYFRTTNSLLANNAISQTLSQVWDDATAKWENYKKGIYTYTSNPKLPSSVLNQNFNTTNSSWVSFENYNYYYDNYGNDTSILIQKWSNNSWVNSLHNIYQYDIHKNITNFLQESWNTTLNQWTYNYKIIYSYGNSDRLLTDTTIKWNANTNNWVNSGRNTYYHNSNGDLLSQQYDVWDTINSVFNPSQKTLNILNLNGKVDTAITLLYNKLTNLWDTVTMDVNHYNGCVLPMQNITLKVVEKENIELSFKVSGFIDLSMYQIEKSIDGVNFFNIKNIVPDNRDSYNYIDPKGNTSKFYYRIKAIAKDGIINYSNIAIIDSKSVKNTIGIYPNPASKGFINIFVSQPCKAKILDMFGKDIKELKLVGGSNTIDISRLQNQQYLLSIRTNGNIETLKFFILQ